MPTAEIFANQSVKPPVFINGRFLSQRVTGVQRYARETMACLDDMLAQDEAPHEAWILLVPKNAPMPAFRHISVRQVGRLQGHLWEQLELPWYCSKGLLLNFGPTGPLLKKRQIVTIHDANVMRIPEAFSWRFRLWYRLLIPRLVARSPLTLAVSRFSAGEASSCFGAPRDRVRVTTEGWQHLDRVEADDRVLDRHGLRETPYVLAVSSPTPNKNFALIVRAMRILAREAPLCAVAGAANPAIYAAASDDGHSMLRLGYVTDEELKALYQNARCFVFPSFYEGFGIPPLEAMSCGCPVLASTAPAVRDVCGDAALYFDPHRPEELADRVREVFSNAALRTGMSRAGCERAALFSWRDGARLNLNFVREVLCNT